MFTFKPTREPPDWTEEDYRFETWDMFLDQLLSTKIGGYLTCRELRDALMLPKKLLIATRSWILSLECWARRRLLMDAAALTVDAPAPRPPKPRTPARKTTFVRDWSSEDVALWTGVGFSALPPARNAPSTDSKPQTQTPVQTPAQTPTQTNVQSTLGLARRLAALLHVHTHHEKYALRLAKLKAKHAALARAVFKQKLPTIPSERLWLLPIRLLFERQFADALFGDEDGTVADTS